MTASFNDKSQWQAKFVHFSESHRRAAESGVLPRQAGVRVKSRSPFPPAPGGPAPAADSDGPGVRVWAGGEPESEPGPESRVRLGVKT